MHEPLRDSAWIADLLDRTARHQLVTRSLSMASGVVTLTGAQRGQTLTYDSAVLRAVFGPKWRLLLIGAGQLSQAVAQMDEFKDFIGFAEVEALQTAFMTGRPVAKA